MDLELWADMHGETGYNEAGWETQITYDVCEDIILRSGKKSVIVHASFDYEEDAKKYIADCEDPTGLVIKEVENRVWVE